MSLEGVERQVKAPTPPADAWRVWLQHIVGCTKVPVAPRGPGEVRTYGYLRAAVLLPITLIAALYAVRGPAIASVVIVVIIWAPTTFLGWRCVVRVSDSGLTAAAPSRGRTFTPWSDIQGFTVAKAWGGTFGTR
jgi:hypothetical protein